MKTIGGSRRSGRTTRLIELCYEAESAGTPSYIVCHTENEARRIFNLAREISKPVSFPLTYDDFMTFHGAPTDFKFFIDNAEYLFKKLLGSPYDIDTIAITLDEFIGWSGCA